jgi:acetylornithine/succinyldiaminopimelate/putrescine aminotransferase
MPEGFRHVPFGDVEALEAAIDGSVAAVIVETIQGEGGVIPATNEYLRHVEAVCRRHGVLLIVDEVQTGFARTGEWFGYQHSGISPDVVTMAKGMGNGMPIGALWARREVAASFRPGDHGSTFSGTPIATCAARATIAEMERIDAPRLAREQGEYLRQSLESIPGVAVVRGIGLLLAAELREGLDAKAVYASLLENGVVVNPVTSTALRFAPPLTVSGAEIDEVTEIMRRVLK